MAYQPIEGRSLFIRLSNSRKAGQKFTTPDLKLRMAHSVANDNDGRLLWTDGGFYMKPETLHRLYVQTLILYSPVTGDIITGRIAKVGEDYDSEILDTYPAASTASQMKGQWFALDNVEYRRDFRPYAYQTVPVGYNTEPQTLDNVIKEWKRRPHTVIEPAQQ